MNFDSIFELFQYERNFSKAFLIKMICFALRFRLLNKQDVFNDKFIENRENVFLAKCLIETMNFRRICNNHNFIVLIFSIIEIRIQSVFLTHSMTFPMSIDCKNRI